MIFSSFHNKVLTAECSDFLFRYVTHFRQENLISRPTAECTCEKQPLGWPMQAGGSQWISETENEAARAKSWWILPGLKGIDDCSLHQLATYFGIGSSPLDHTPECNTCVIGCHWGGGGGAVDAWSTSCPVCPWFVLWNIAGRRYWEWQCFLNRWKGRWHFGKQVLVVVGGKRHLGEHQEAETGANDEWPCNYGCWGECLPTTENPWKVGHST